MRRKYLHVWFGLCVFVLASCGTQAIKSPAIQVGKSDCLADKQLHQLKVYEEDEFWSFHSVIERQQESCRMIVLSASGRRLAELMLEGNIWTVVNSQSPVTEPRLRHYLQAWYLNHPQNLLKSAEWRVEDQENRRKFLFKDKLWAELVYTSPLLAQSGIPSSWTYISADKATRIEIQVVDIGSP